MSFVNDEKIYVATYKEIVLIFVAFSVVLFVLYPKNLLKEQILQDTSNNDLSMIYLQNMLKQDPSNESLILLVANNNYKSGKLMASYGLLQPLLNSKNPEIKKNANLLSYKLAKEDYYIVKDEKRKIQIKDDMRGILKDIVDNHYYSKENLDEFYKESYFLGMTGYTFILLKERISYAPDDIKMLSDAYYLADTLNLEPEAISYLHILEQKDSTNKEKWLLTEYSFYMKKRELDNAEKLLQDNSKGSTKWTERLAEFYLGTSSYKKASQTYMGLYGSSKDKKYFIEALKSLQAGSYLKEAADLGYKYENYYLDDESVRVYLLKLYLAANDLQKASSLSKKILTHKKK